MITVASGYTLQVNGSGRSRIGRLFPFFAEEELDIQSTFGKINFTTQVFLNY